MMLHELKGKLIQAERRIAQLEDLVTSQGKLIQTQRREIDKLKKNDSNPIHGNAVEKEERQEKKEGEQSVNSSSFFDVGKLLRLTQQESKFNDMEFELEQLRMDNSLLKGDITREQKAAVLFRNLY